MKTAHRIGILTSDLNELQACLSRLNGRTGKRVEQAQRIAAELALSLEDWYLETLHIPAAERERYRSTNPYFAAN